MCSGVFAIVRLPPSAAPRPLPSSHFRYSSRLPSAAAAAAAAAAAVTMFRRSLQKSLATTTELVQISRKCFVCLDYKI